MMHRDEHLLSLIVKPLVTEKATMAEANNQYTFQVLKQATKHQVAQAVNLMYGVDVDAVNVINSKGKQKRTGRVLGRRNHTKKAIVTVADGQTIDFQVQAEA